ncbi:MAG: hypothetical protein EOP06_01000 [Proteobacteria bacterium]|nr:MAG: hypothetical protein EOP06_01000 [Pseudomonadota bacterium]
MRIFAFLLLSLVIHSTSSFAKTVRYDLTIRNEKVNMSGKKTVDFALTVNGGIPAPTLEFTEGDDAEILIKNELPDEEVSIHWHGLLLPPDQDGVPYVNTPPIHGGKSYLFKFKIRQNGTYWYHSHTMLQEQKGVYGGIVIHPKKKPLAYDRDAVLVLSDWSDEDADQILRNLRKDGDYYQYKKDSVRSYFGALKQGTASFKSNLYNEWIRMGGMDLSDVGYDAFLINGKRDSQLVDAKPGEKIRLRIINAAASSYFYVAMGVPMTVISSDGVDVEPISAKEILIGMAETYDVLFTVPDSKSYEVRATVQDVTGYASAWIGTGEKISAPTKEKPDLYASMDHSNMAGMDHSSMGGMNHSKMSGMDHSKMEGMDHSTVTETQAAKHGDGSHSGHQGGKVATGHASHLGHGKAAPSEAPTAIEHSGHMGHGAEAGKADKKASTSEQPQSVFAQAIDWTTQSDAMLKQNASARNAAVGNSEIVDTLSVDALKALQPTTLPKDAPVHDLRLVLNGDMNRYVWHINGKAINQDRLLEIKKGEVVRITFVNESMMHHPMHLHGHFFRVLNAAGERSPLKHTVDVSPHMTRVIEFYANEPGQWMLHCHNLYHMDSGMARVVRYHDFKLDDEMQAHDKHDPHTHDHLYTYTSLEAASNHARAQFKLMKTWDELDFEIESAQVEGQNFAYDKPWETEGDAYYRRWFGNWLNVFGGASLYDEEGYATVGAAYILPFLIEASASVNHEGKFRFDIERRFQWTKSVFTDSEFTWRPNWGGERDAEFEISLMYGPSWRWAAGLMATEKRVGVGAQIQF